MDKRHAVTMIILGLIVLIFMPLGTIWSLNTLFLLDIPYTIWTWLATAFLTFIFASKIK